MAAGSCDRAERDRDPEERTMLCGCVREARRKRVRDDMELSVESRSDSELRAVRLFRW